MSSARVYLEVGAKRVFACALDWPGWCRSARTEEAAVEALLAYAPRYAAVAGETFDPGDEVHVVGRLPGNGTTDFGAPDARGRWDDEPLTCDEAERQSRLLVASWEALDRAVAAAPAELRKGPRGGGRDRDAVADHVREAERSWPARYAVRRLAWHVLDHAWEIEDRATP